MLHGRQVSRLTGLTLLAGLLGLAACAGETADQEAAADDAVETTEGQAAGAGEGMGEAPHGQVSMVGYECADGGAFTLTVAPGVAKAALRLADGEVHQLDQVEVASGMEFSDGTYTFRGKGPEADVEMDGEPLLSDCKAAGHPQ